MQHYQHVLGARHRHIEQAPVAAIIAGVETRGQQIGPEQQHDAELQAACAMHGQDLHRFVPQRAHGLVAGRQHRAGEAANEQTDPEVPYLPPTPQKNPISDVGAITKSFMTRLGS